MPNNSDYPNPNTQINTPPDKIVWNQPENYTETSQTPQFNNNFARNSKVVKNRSFFASVNNFFRTIGIFTILLILLVSSFFTYILLQPQSDFSKWVINNSLLEKYLTIKEDTNNIALKEEEAKNISNFLGLNTTAGTFQFSKPGDSRTTTEVVESALPSVLSLSVSEEGSRFSSTGLISGTGFIVSEDGLVVTNKHVIAKKCTDTLNSIKILGLSHDQKAYELELLTVDPIDDIAILKIIDSGETKFSPVKFAEIRNIPLGSEVIAVGNVLGQLQNTVTKGIVSGLNRTVETSKSNTVNDECTSTRVTFIDNLVQTDAAINKGNSGGPLFNSSGLLIGMNTLGALDSQNIGFALSSDLIVSNLNSYKKNGKIVRPRLGIYSRPITPIQKQESTWLPTDYGEILLNPSETESAVSSGSPADGAGLQAGDILLELNNEKLQAKDSNPSPLRRSILSKQPEEEVTLVVRKAISGDPSTGYKYENDNRTIKVKLGSIDFQINKSKTL